MLQDPLLYDNNIPAAKNSKCHTRCPPKLTLAGVPSNMPRWTILKRELCLGLTHFSFAPRCFSFSTHCLCTLSLLVHPCVGSCISASLRHTHARQTIIVFTEMRCPDGCVSSHEWNSLSHHTYYSLIVFFATSLTYLAASTCNPAFFVTPS
jgi:hypothetical protein